MYKHLFLLFQHHQFLINFSKVANRATIQTPEISATLRSFNSGISALASLISHHYRCWEALDQEYHQSLAIIERILRRPSFATNWAVMSTFHSYYASIFSSRKWLLYGDPVFQKQLTLTTTTQKNLLHYYTDSSSSTFLRIQQNNIC